MNDKLRFRVWDKVFNEYWTNEQIKENAGWLLFPDNANINDIEIERCTGSKDRNGKLIYEGDVIKVTNLANKYVLNTPVIWEKDICAFMVWGNKAKTYGNYIGALMEEDDDGIVHYIVEVIGNIHENPELLEK